MTTEIAHYILEIQELSESDIALAAKMQKLKHLLERLCKHLTQDEAMQFPNLFSRLVFIAQKHQLPHQLEWQLQNFRVQETSLRKNPQKKITKKTYLTAEKAILNLCHYANGEKTEAKEQPVPKTESVKNTEKLRVQILSINREKKQLICATESTPSARITVKYGIAPDNNAFDSSAERFKEGFQLNLIDSSIDKNGCFVPKYIILEPDYLVDASAVAECFQDYAVSPLHFFRSKFEEKENRSYLLLGNLANFFLDELVFAKDLHSVSFSDTFFRSFKQSPFEYTSCGDIRSEHDFRAFMTKAENQFRNIKRVIAEDFPKRGIDVHHCTLEPSFFSEQFGFQGRLDLLYLDPEYTHAGIVELKSGRLPFPASNSGKIALNHEVQTAIYRLMVESVFGKNTRQIDAAILYAAGENAGENLRFAATYKELEKQIINLRNLIVANEYNLTHGNNETVDDLFRELFRSVQTTERLPAFFTDKIQQIKNTIAQCNALELNYFYRYIRFISRELYLQKIGDIEYESPTGVAALWNSDFTERAEALDVISELEIEEMREQHNGMTIIFRRNKKDKQIVNFREGEICIVYPRNTTTDSVLNTQILKGTIARISADAVEVRFRYKQKNQRFFADNKLWAIEHDTLDTSYNAMYKSIFSFLNAAKQKRDLLLGTTPPAASKTKQITKNYPNDHIEKALAATDYFLVVGPPGTGKTSIFARRLIEEYYADAEKNILVLAYTNRAVDELCEAIHAAFGATGKECDRYIRIGTELSCGEGYRNRLLQRIAETAKNRGELRNEIDRTRIYVSTLASVAGRMDLFNLKHFHVAVIDEASQILEPQIIGLLPLFDRFVMIGDQNQLSTIVLQKPAVSRIDDEILTEAGITDCRDSLFERLLRTCIKNEWSHAYTQLTHQGRMHEEIAAYPATYFYASALFPANTWQTEAWHLQTDNATVFQETVASKRTAFFSTENIYASTPSNKINETEADIVVQLIKSIQIVYIQNNRPFSAEKLGVIAPYRNQIALIKHKLAEAGIADSGAIMVDTVERFQGSQRDVMLVSFCVNKPYQLNFLCNLNTDGTVDRKLNVALTRARQQLFLIGNARILQSHTVYGTLLEFYKNNTIVL